MKKKQTDYHERIKNAAWVQWQIIRRHKHFIKFCDTQPFKVNTKLLDSQDSPRATKIKKRFRLNVIYHYSKDLSIDQCLDAVEGNRSVIRIYPKATDFDKKSLPQYGNFVYFGVNIADDIKLKDIKAGIERGVGLARNLRKVMQESRQQDKKRELKRLNRSGFGAIPC